MDVLYVQQYPNIPKLSQTIPNRYSQHFHLPKEAAEPLPLPAPVEYSAASMGSQTSRHFVSWLFLKIKPSKIHQDSVVFSCFKLVWLVGIGLPHYLIALEGKLVWSILMAHAMNARKKYQEVSIKSSVPTSWVGMLWQRWSNLECEQGWTWVSQLHSCCGGQYLSFYSDPPEQMH